MVLNSTIFKASPKLPRKVILSGIFFPIYPYTYVCIYQLKLIVWTQAINNVYVIANPVTHHQPTFKYKAQLKMLNKDA